MTELKGAIKVALENVDTDGGIFAIPNPEEADLIITLMVVKTSVIATAACTLDAGVAASLVTASATLIDGLDLNGALVVANNVDDQGTDGKLVQKWDSDEFVTGTAKTGASAGLVGFVYIEYIRD